MSIKLSPVVKMDRDSKDREENCQLKENRVHEDAGGLIVQNPNQTLKYGQMNIREKCNIILLKLGTRETIFGSGGRGGRLILKKLVFDVF